MIELTRSVWDKQHNRDESVSVSFSDLDGKMASIAFDGRYNVNDRNYAFTLYNYGTFADCPVIDENATQHKNLTDLESLRVLRDTLNRMNLGD